MIRRNHGKVCRCCGCYFWPNKIAPRVDFAGGHLVLCRSCWPKWRESAEFKAGAAQPITDRGALERWLTSHAGALEIEGVACA